MRPCDRVRSALNRLSRDRWISGDECRKLVHSLACCCSGSPSTVAKAAMAAECEFVGMLRGYPPAFIFEDDYRDFFIALSGLKRDSQAKAELLILKLQLKRMNKWK